MGCDVRLFRVLSLDSCGLIAAPRERRAVAEYPGGRGAWPLNEMVGIRYVMTSLKGSAEYLYEDVYCKREAD
jgi:hypothetical protein